MLFSIEVLEGRRHFSATPTIYEQYILTLINRARTDPLAEAARDGIDLNEGISASDTISPTPKQPLAFDVSLLASADGHTQWMLDNNVFTHEGPGGNTAFERDQAAGYQFVAPYAYGENIAYSGEIGALPEAVSTIDRMQKNLFVDSGVSGRGHRTIMMTDYYHDAGVGLASGTFTSSQGAAQVWMQTQEYATTAGNAAFTGVLFNDGVIADGMYTPNEGLGYSTIQATSLTTGNVYRTVTWGSGGYTLKVPPGTYHVVAYGGSLAGRLERGDITISDQNVLVDFNTSVMAATPSLGANGVLLVSGSAGDDAIRIFDTGSAIRVAHNGWTWDFATAKVRSIEVHAGTGNDLVVNDTSLPSYLVGDDGNDTLWGGPGNDTIDGAIGNDLLYGRNGNDVIFGGQGQDTLFGGQGDDYLVGNRGDDRLVGNEGNDTLDGGPGNDTLEGNQGDDLLLARDGARDVIYGGIGNNRGMVDPLLDSVTNVQLLL